MNAARVLDSLLEAVTSAQPIANVSSYVTEQDQVRFEDIQTSGTSQDVTQFKNNWRAKFDSDFDSSTVFARNVSGALKVLPGADDKQMNIEIAQQQNLAPIKLRLVKEGAILGSWHIAIPDHLDAATLQDALRTQYKALRPESLPQDRNQAELYAARTLLQPFAIQ